MYRDLTKGNITRSLLLFALPMIAGNLLQQFYNIADTLIVGRVLGSNALAAVGSAYTLMTFLTSIFLGLSMGSGALFSIYLGKGDHAALKRAIVHAFMLILAVTVVLNVLVYLLLDPILVFLQVPAEVWDGMRSYLLVIFAGLLATSLYNFFSCLLRALGNSTAPLLFLAVSALLNIGLDLLFVAVLPWGIQGAALAGSPWSPAIAPRPRAKAAPPAGAPAASASAPGPGRPRPGTDTRRAPASCPLHPWRPPPPGNAPRGSAPAWASFRGTPRTCAWESSWASSLLLSSENPFSQPLFHRLSSAD